MSWQWETSLIGLLRLVAVTLTCQLPDWLNSLVTAGLAVVTSLPSENLNTYTRSFRLQRRPVNKNFLLYMCMLKLFCLFTFILLECHSTLVLIWHLITNLILCTVDENSKDDIRKNGGSIHFFVYLSWYVVHTWENK